MKKIELSSKVLGVLSLFLYVLDVAALLYLLGTVAIMIFGIETPENEAIVIFFIVLSSYLCLLYQINEADARTAKKFYIFAMIVDGRRWLNLFAKFSLYAYATMVLHISEIKRDHLKNNLALMNSTVAMTLLAAYINHFFWPFEPIGQAIFGWPALIGSILLSLASYAGFKERIYRYGKKMKFWKKSFWTRMFHKSFYRVIVRLMPKIGLTLITMGTSILIVNSCLESSYQAEWIKNLYTSLIGSGIAIWVMVLFILGGAYVYSIREAFLISVFMENGKTREEAQKEANDTLSAQLTDNGALSWPYANTFMSKDKS